MLTYHIFWALWVDLINKIKDNCFFYIYFLRILAMMKWQRLNFPSLVKQLGNDKIFDSFRYWTTSSIGLLYWEKFSLKQERQALKWFPAYCLKAFYKQQKRWSQTQLSFSAELRRLRFREAKAATVCGAECQNGCNCTGESTQRSCGTYHEAFFGWVLNYTHV